MGDIYIRIWIWIRDSGKARIKGDRNNQKKGGKKKKQDPISYSTHTDSRDKTKKKI